MRFSTIAAIPLLVVGALAIQDNVDVLQVRSEGVVANADDVLKVSANGIVANADKMCILGHCLDAGKGGPKCNVDRKHINPKPTAQS